LATGEKFAGRIFLKGGFHLREFFVFEKQTWVAPGAETICGGNPMKAVGKGWKDPS